MKHNFQQNQKEIFRKVLQHHNKFIPYTSTEKFTSLNQTFNVISYSHTTQLSYNHLPIIYIFWFLKNTKREYRYCDHIIIYLKSRGNYINDPLNIVIPNIICTVIFMIEVTPVIRLPYNDYIRIFYHHLQGNGQTSDHK